MTSHSILKCLPFIAGLASAVALTLAGGPVQAEQRCIEVCVYGGSGRPLLQLEEAVHRLKLFSDAVVRWGQEGPRYRAGGPASTSGQYGADYDWRR